MANDISKTAKITSFAVRGVSQPQFFLHLHLQFYYISVAVTLFRVCSMLYDVHGSHNF